MRHYGLDDGFNQCAKAIETWLYENRGTTPSSIERFRVIDGDDAPKSLVFVCYWDDERKYDEGIRKLNLRHLYRQLDTQKQQSVGLWCERFTSDISRLETNYTGLDYLPGLARIPGTSTVDHTYTAYWGAARDRIPDSAFDLFEQEKDSVTAVPPDPVPSSLGKYLIGTNYHNMVHIRSGQFWKNCDEDEKRSYEEGLEPTLREGLSYLWKNPVDSGSMGLRYLLNVPSSSSQSEKTYESCVTGFFRSLADLETWAKRHSSHLAIYTGAIKHAKNFGDKRKFRTWHEVSVLRSGSGQFEYLNCLPETGVIKRISLTSVSD
ncbi:phenylacetaldoxime dehydratase family protein [Aspergillus tanneri]|uniref:Phenylacetaldoxime dehydratase n=1 Tax=Aspergillus tanneri TaxID=1220188 RepID=A0A5M9MGT3_9EURO|nr:uncharacterized protein ATNIH1004_009187 [Aspergillus tanneri]KAA8644976.1 hypothetical protein ATNIH1004_009187 [Aspergillus tanneri]